MRISISCIMLLYFSSLIHAQDVKKQFFAKATEALRVKKDRYYQSRKITAKLIIYAVGDTPENAVGKVLSEVDVVKIYDGEGRLKSEITASTRPNLVGNTYFITEDLWYSVVKKDGQYSIRDLVSRIDSSRAYFAKLNDRTEFIMSSFNGYSPIEYILQVEPAGEHAKYYPSFDSLTNKSWNGRDALELSVHNLSVKSDPVKRIVDTTSSGKHYYDAKNSMNYLGSEYTTMGDLIYGVPHKRFAQVEYADVPGEKFPIPKRFTKHVQFENGPRLLQFEAIFTSYEKYTPDADEFRLEKLYGLPTPVGPDYKSFIGKTSSASNGRYWYLIAAGVAIAAGMVVILRRRSRAIVTIK